jgi:hypothetical protein
VNAAPESVVASEMPLRPTGKVLSGWAEITRLARHLPLVLAVRALGEPLVRATPSGNTSPRPALP